MNLHFLHHGLPVAEKGWSRLRMGVSTYITGCLILILLNMHEVMYGLSITVLLYDIFRNESSKLNSFNYTHNTLIVGC